LISLSGLSGQGTIMAELTIITADDAYKKAKFKKKPFWYALTTTWKDF